MENKKEIVLEEINQTNKEPSLENVESISIETECLKETIEQDANHQQEAIQNENVQDCVVDDKEESNQEITEDLNKEDTESVKKVNLTNASENLEIVVDETTTEVTNQEKAEEKLDKINLKDSLIKAADQIKEADVYEQIKKSGIYSQVKEMFIKIKQNDFDFTFSKRDQWIALGIIIVVLFFDQITKIIASNLLMEYESYEIIDHFFYFTFIHNPGMAWGTFEGMRWLFVVITPFILMFVLHIFVYSKKHEIYTRAGMILVFAGAIGNWIDRLLIGEVRDFIHFIIPIIEYDFPIFNIADIAVVVGMGLVVLEVIIQEYQIWKLSKSL